VKTILFGTAAALALATVSFAQQPQAPVNPPAGAYTMDKNHSSITWRVKHLGTSTYTARFDSFDAKLNFDPNAPEKSTLDVSIDPTSLDVNYYKGEAKSSDFHDELVGEKFFNTVKFPTITFKATKVEKTGDKTGKITGDLTFLGVTKPLTLDVTYNGARNGMGPGAGPVVGFSGKATVKRSDWGFTTYAGALGDDVDVWIETEFSAPKA
jgi:polyisoprenoid-binding protein YceI